ncbi:MAG: hypothetical protein Q9170_002109 [Blastenia crenularia]
MDIHNMLNNKGSAAAAAAAAAAAVSDHQLAQHGGHMQQSIPMLASSPDVQRNGMDNGYTHPPSHLDNHQHPGQGLIASAAGGSDAVKAFACGTCGKGFARRSDLARHGRRNSSLSPSSEAPRMPNMNRHSVDFTYMPSGPLPHHLRHDLQPSSIRSSPSIGSPTLSAYGGVPPASNQHRPSLTSHPAMYGPPPILEPPTHPDHRHTGSSGSSPHLSSVGWQSPIPSLGSPARDSYLYPEPPFAQSAPHLYYPNSNLRRPQSTEPDQYETKPRMVGGEVWAGSI